MAVWGRYREALVKRRVLIAGTVLTFGLTAILYANDQWKAGSFISIWGANLFNLAEQLRHQVEGG